MKARIAAGWGRARRLRRWHVQAACTVVCAGSSALATAGVAMGEPVSPWAVVMLLWTLVLCVFTITMLCRQRDRARQAERDADAWVDLHRARGRERAN